MTARALWECDDVEQLLSPCVDGELLEDESVAVRAHVAGCDACRARLAQLTSLKAALHSAGSVVALPPELEARLHADLRTEARRGRVSRFGVAAAVALAVVAVVGVAVIALPSQKSAPAAVVAKPAKPANSRVVDSAVQRHRAMLPVDVASPDPRPVQEFLAQRLGHRLRVPRLEQLGFGLQGGRVVDVEDRQGAQLVYSGGYGQRLSVVAVPDPDGKLAAAVESAESIAADDNFAGDLAGDAETGGALRVRVVKSEGAVYTIVGDVDDARLERVSTAISR